MSGLFSLKESINFEMERISKIMTVDPDRGVKIHSLGDNLIICAKGGMLSKFKRLTVESNPDDILIYYIAKSFEASLLNGNLMISTYILDNGYPLNDDSLPLCLHNCLSVLDDNLCPFVVEFLVAKTIDINKQAPKTWLTPLHIAVKHQLYKCSKLLIGFGSDVNAVADGDIMPLNIAYNSPNQTDTNRLIIEMLIENGAKETWRSNKLNITNVFNTSTESTSISVDNHRTVKQERIFVKFCGGGGGISEIDTVLLVDKQLSNLNISSHETASESNDTGFKLSDDGGLMFST